MCTGNPRAYFANPHVGKGEIMFDYLRRSAGWIVTVTVAIYFGYQLAWPNSFIHGLWRWQNAVMILAFAIGIVLIGVFLINDPSKWKIAVSALIGLGLAITYYTCTLHSATRSIRLRPSRLRSYWGR